MAYVHKQLKESGAEEKSDLVKYGMKIIHCCLACFERCIKFLNKVAYI